MEPCQKPTLKPLNTNLTIPKLNLSLATNELVTPSEIKEIKEKIEKQEALEQLDLIDEIPSSFFQTTDLNLEGCDIDTLFDSLQKCEGVPEQIKKDLFFIQSDQ